MFDFKLYPADVHGWFWDEINQSGYAEALRMRTREQEQMTIDMLNCALFEIFKSIEPIVGFTPQDLMAKYINPELLFSLLEKNGEAKMVRHAVVSTVHANPFDKNSPLVHVPNVIERIPEDIELTYMAYIAAFRKFRDKIELMLRRACGEKFNRFAMVNLDIIADRHERVRAIDLKIHGDIRIKYYMEHFADGRYDTRKDSQP